MPDGTETVSDTGKGSDCPGHKKCAGCYVVAVIDGFERWLHPPRVSQFWEKYQQKVEEAVNKKKRDK